MAGEPVSKLDMAILRSQARTALTSLGWKPAIAHAAVDAAAVAQGPGLTLERLPRTDRMRSRHAAPGRPADRATHAHVGADELRKAALFPRRPNAVLAVPSAPVPESGPDP
jgi:hypothetical protein